MFVLDEINVRDVKLMDDLIWFVSIRKIISKDHLSVLDEGPKTVGMSVPSRPQTREQSTASRGCDAQSKVFIYC